MILLFNMPEKRHLKIVKKPGKRQIFQTNMEGINLKKSVYFLLIFFIIYYFSSSFNFRDYQFKKQLKRWNVRRSMTQLRFELKNQKKFEKFKCMYVHYTEKGYVSHF